MDPKTQQTMQLDETVALSACRDLAQLVNDLRHDRHNGSDGGFSKKIDTMEDDMFEQIVQMWK